MPDIKTLDSEIARLSGTVDWWNSAIIVMMIVAAVAAAGLVATQFIAFARAKALTEAQSQLDVLRASQLAAELREKDVRITEANEKGASATERAEKAGQRAAEANRLAQEEMLARVRIEERLAWRRITPQLHHEMVLALIPYAGSVILMNSLANGDPEAETFENELEKTMRDANWDVRRGRGNTMIPSPIGLICHVNEHTAAGRVLAGFLKRLPTAIMEPVQVQSIPGIAAIIFGVRPPP